MGSIRSPVRSFCIIALLAAFSAQYAWSLGYPVIFDGETIKFQYGGWWGDKAGKTIMSQTTEEFHSGTSCLKIDMNWDPGYYGAAWGWNWAGWSVMGTYDARNATAVEMWVKGNVGWGGMNIWLTDGNAKNSAITSINQPTTNWQKFTIPISAFSGIDLSKVWEIAGDTHALYGSGYIMYLDDVIFVDPAYGTTSRPLPGRHMADRKHGSSYVIAGSGASLKDLTKAGPVAAYDIRGAALHHTLSSQSPVQPATGIVIIHTHK